LELAARSASARQQARRLSAWEAVAQPASAQAQLQQAV